MLRTPRAETGRRTLRRRIRAAFILSDENVNCAMISPIWRACKRRSPKRLDQERTIVRLLLLKRER